jgi:hypothetical protein
MATCPECWNSKPFFAPRCTSCNQEIGFFMQLVFSTIATAATVIGLVGIFYLLTAVFG